MSSSYYYEQPFEETTTKTTTTTSSKPKKNNILIIFIIVIVVILLLALILTLVKSTNKNTNTISTNSNDVIRLQFRGAFLNSSDIQPLLDDYHALHSNITIDYANKFPVQTKYSDAEKQYKSDLDRLFRQDDAVAIPDIFMVHNTWAGDYDTTYSQASPTSVYDYSTFNNTFYPAISDDFAHDKAVHGVPLWMDTYALLYNKDQVGEKNHVSDLQNSSLNWTTFKNIAFDLTKTQNNTITQAGFAAGGSNNITYSFELFNLLLFQSGIDMLGKQGETVFATKNDAAIALKFYQGFGSINGTWDTSNNFPNESAAFLESKVSMILASSNRYRDIKYYNNKYQANVNIGIAQVPQLSGQTQPIINWADYWGAMVALKRPNGTAAWEFLKWLTQPDQLKKLNNNVAKNNNSFGLLYPRKDMQELLQNDPDLKIYNASLPFAKSWYMVKGIEVKDEFNKLLSQVGSTDLASLAQTQANVQLLINNKGKI